MSTVHVTITTTEQEAAGLDSPEIVHTNADGVVTAEGTLLVYQQYTVLAEYPVGRYVAWSVTEEEDGA